MKSPMRIGAAAFALVLSAAFIGFMFSPANASDNMASAAVGVVNPLTVVNDASLQDPHGPAANQINTSDKAAVQKAYLTRFYKNQQRVAQSHGANLAACQAGEVIAEGITPMVESWNFLRGLNGLNAVSVDPNSPLTKYAMSAAMVQARNGALSHRPDEANFECATQEAVLGSAHANLAQSTGQTPAQQILWYYIDYSRPDNPINDSLGHRLFMMDPEISQSGIGEVAGFTAVQVRTGVDLPGVPSATMTDPNAPTPETMGWPSAGYFPVQLLPTIGSTSHGDDVNRWSFSVRGADMSEATATVTGPDGRDLPVQVIRPNEPGMNPAYTPRSLLGYSTVLLKLPALKGDQLPVGQEDRTYTVTVNNVKGTASDSYSYQVILFDPMTPLGKSLPEVNITSQPLTAAGNELPDPLRAEFAGWPAPELQWQESVNGSEWTNIPGATGDTYRPEGAWDAERAANTSYRVMASNAVGSKPSAPVSVSLQGIAEQPQDLSVAAGEDAVWSGSALVDQDGTLYGTEYEWQGWNGDAWVPLPENEHFVGVNTNQLTVKAADERDDQMKVRLVVRSHVYRMSSFVVLAVTSDSAVLTVQ